MSATRGSSRTVLGNLVNDVMIENAPPSYARAMASVTPRKLWLARPDDCLVVLAPCRPAFRDYVERTLGTDLGRVELVQPDEIFTGHALDLVEQAGAVGKVASRSELLPFVLDHRVVEFAARTGTPVAGYDALPTQRTLCAVRRINTKHGFRSVARALGLPVAPGGHARTLPELCARLEEFLKERPAAIVKINRSSNGYGTVVVRAGGPKSPTEQLTESLGRADERGCGWVYEEFLDFVSVPSAEMIVEEHGPVPFSSCDQRTVDSAWTGMTAPAEARGAAIAHEAALAIGAWLHGEGFRGVFDVDCCLLPDGHVVTEANVRRTGGTYLEELARRLTGQASPYWLADVRRGDRGPGFDVAVDAIESAGLAEGPTRVVLTADTTEIDGRWRYLVVGSDRAALLEAERVLASILELP
ncbi:peptide ligase PGM1-related protein [Streptomyces sp. CA-256286]|uniref:preATP grasp domain-containing protein n=1 Tax=Streptomyces sp. CA-256286 TaxID=2801033 RepID=UPI001A984B58|nr:peptide ligase PGM1-related protein [Streptomyces sp. CA-256286]QTA36133.1 Pre ATP-grasp domain protein [Streptomyces sp. CA-256286]